MARIKITNASIKAKLTKWASGQEREDELIFFANEINQLDIMQMSWNLAAMIIQFQEDSVTGFHKITFVEKL